MEVASGEEEEEVGGCWTFRGPGYILSRRRRYPIMHTPGLLSPAGGGGHAPRNAVIGLRLKSTYWNDLGCLAQCQTCWKSDEFISSIPEMLQREGERDRERGEKGQRASLFPPTIASVHHPRRMHACARPCTRAGMPSAYADAWSKFDVDPLCPRTSALTAVHLLQGLRCCLISSRCPWELSADMPVSPGWTALVNYSLNSPALDSAFGGKSIIWHPPPPPPPLYISQSIFSMLGPITPSRKTTLYVISKMTSILQLHTECR